MLILSEIIEKLKDVLSESAIGKKVFDKDVATALNIPQATFATMKKRNSIPYEEILEFCAIKKISVNWLFFDQAVDMLKAETEKFFQVRYFADIRASAGGGAYGFDEDFETIILKVSTYNYLRNLLTVVMLVKYVEKEKEAYWELVWTRTLVYFETASLPLLTLLVNY